MRADRLLNRPGFTGGQLEDDLAAVCLANHLDYSRSPFLRIGTSANRPPQQFSQIVNLLPGDTVSPRLEFSGSHGLSSAGPPVALNIEQSIVLAATRLPGAFPAPAVAPGGRIAIAVALLGAGMFAMGIRARRHAERSLRSDP